MVNIFYSIHKHFRNGDLEKIEKAIERAEKKSTGEIVVVLASSSHNYLVVPLFFALLGFIVSLLVLLGIDFFHPFILDFKRILSIEVFAITVFGIFGAIPSVIRIVLGSNRIKSKVIQAAMAEFIINGLSNTKERSGILIYLSELERQVVILADKGINDILGNSAWDKGVEHIVNGIKRGNAADTIIEAIDEMAISLHKNFPAHSDNKNELRNTVIVRS